MRMSIALPAVVVLFAAGLSGCDRPTVAPPAGEAVPEAPRTVELAAAPVVQADSGGFSYRPGELTPGFPAVLTVDLGPRLRVYVLTERVVPATLTLFGAGGRELRRMRIDLPRGGTLRAPSGLLGPGVEAFRLSGLAQEGDPSSGPGAGSAKIVAETGGTLQPDFGSVKIWALQAPRVGSVAGVPATFHELYSGSLVADHWAGEGAPPDDHWLSERVRESLREATSRPAALAPVPGAGR